MKNTHIILGLISIFIFTACVKKKKSNSSCTISDISLPFDYYEENGVLMIKTGTDATKKLRLSLGPFGAHAPMYTGHYVGNSKQDLQAHYAISRSEMTPVPLGNGVCDPNETCGIAESELLERSPIYRVPDKITQATVTSVKLGNIYSPGGMYYGGLNNWTIELSACDYTFSFTHLRKISSTLREKLMAAGAPDPDTYTTVGGDIGKGKGITVTEGDLLGYPQIAATQIDSSGYYQGGGGTEGVPWAQMEFSHRKGNVTESYYKLLSTNERNLLQDYLEDEVSNPNSFRYAKYFQDPKYQWLLAAEAVLETAQSTYNGDYSGLFSNLGGWIEDSSDCVTNQPLCNEALSIFPIAKTSGLHNPALYATNDVSYLFFHRIRSIPYPGQDRWGEILTPSVLDPLSGAFTIGWHGERGIVPSATVTKYQKVRYLLSGNVLKVKWGTESDTLNGASEVAEIGSESCNGTTLTCHGHKSRGD
jgi:hypothetical protein